MKADQYAELTVAGTYRDHLVATAAALYAAARTEKTLHLNDLDIVLSGRRAVLDLLAAVHEDLTGLQHSPEPLHPHDIEAHPVEALGRALRRYPRPTGRLCPTDVALARPRSDAGHAWQRAARHAVVAQHAWTTGVREPMPGPAHWAAIADIAALADVLARLDVGLVVATAKSPGHLQVTAELRAGLDQALGVTARETLRLASRGPLPEVGPDRTPAPALRVVRIRGVADVPLAQGQLATLLEHGGQLRPERLPALAAQQVRTCLMLADTLNEAAPSTLVGDKAAYDAPVVQAALRRHAHTLLGATLRRHSVASITPGDGRALRQAAEIAHWLPRAAKPLTSEPALLRGMVSGVAATSRALSTAASRALSTGNWLVPEVGDSLEAPLWRRPRRTDPTPSPVLALRRAAADSVELLQAVTPPMPLVSGTTAAARTRAPRRSSRAIASTDRLRLSARRPQMPGFSPTPAVARPR